MSRDFRVLLGLGFLVGIFVPTETVAQEASEPCEAAECCRRAEGAELYGQVLAAESGQPLPGATVEFRVISPPEEGTPSVVEVETDDAGAYRHCGIATPAQVESRATHSGATSRSLSFRLEDPGRVELSFEIRGVPAGLDSLREAAAASREAAAPGRVVGRIEDAGSGRPVAEATVTLEPSGMQALTDRRGQFEIPEAPAGEGELAIHHVAYGDQTVDVDVPSELTLSLEIDLPPKAIEVEPIDVRVEATIRSRFLENRGFYDRMERDFGHFWSPEKLERRNPLRVSHVLQQTPGVRIARDCSSGRCRSVPYMSASAPQATGSYSRSQDESGMTVIEDNRGFTVCAARVYIDGHKIMKWKGMGVDDFVNASDLAAVEVYRGAGGMAPEFVDSDARCGVVVLWTKHGPGPPSGSQP